MATYVHDSLCLTSEMTSNSAPSPNVTNASTTQGTYAAWRVFNQSVAGMWLDTWISAFGNNTGWVKFDFGSGNSEEAVKYTLSNVDNSDYLDYAPKTWTIQGSNNDADWDVLDTQTNVSSWVANEMREYLIASPAAYRYYKIDITLNQGNGSYVLVSELELIAAPPPTHYYSGYITEMDSPVSRQVNLYNRSTGELVDTTTSSGSNGYYYLNPTTSGEHFIVVFDDEGGENYNALILDRLLPTGIE